VALDVPRPHTSRDAWPLPIKDHYKETGTVKSSKTLLILGTRGIPAGHGGFETFAEHFAFYMQQRGWNVIVYCQEKGVAKPYDSTLKGVTLRHISVSYKYPWDTIAYDYMCIKDAAATPGVCVILGYNTAIFSVLLAIRRRTILFNMDGIEWKREKWSRGQRAWLWLNEWIGCVTGTRLIADHPKIKEHLQRHARPAKIRMIPYGADEITAADPAILAEWGVAPSGFAMMVGRIEPENSILTIVRAYARSNQPVPLLVVGTLDPDRNAYHRELVAAASDNIRFVGAIYDQTKLKCLRFFTRLYIHGHTVGGTNPSLVEALGGAGAILAHDNHFNRWVAGPTAAYFANERECEARLTSILSDERQLEMMKLGSQLQHKRLFTWEQVLGEYEDLVEEFSEGETGRDVLGRPMITDR
jgi:glycosyltransferase involved in cell wall biosynthesis